MKYNYVLLGASSDLYEFSYSDLKKTDYAYYIPGMDYNLGKIGNFLFRLHTWNRLNKIIELPFKRTWNRFLLGRFPFKGDKKLCFILMGSWVEYDNQLHLLDYLRSKYKGCKIVWFLQDLIATRRMHDGSPLSIEDLKNRIDIIFSFDQNDCKKYGLSYHHLVFSSYENGADDRPDSDVYFLGKAKNRHKDIIKVFEILKGHGLKCDFHIAGVPIEEQAYRDEIDYDPHISYKENLQRILHTKCLLELMQKDGTGFTQRGCEAVCLNKKLLTNNPEIKNAPFYNSEYISCFTDVIDIDINFITDITKPMVVDYNYKYKFSPVKLLEFIDEKLN